MKQMGFKAWYREDIESLCSHYLDKGFEAKFDYKKDESIYYSHFYWINHLLHPIATVSVPINNPKSKHVFVQLRSRMDDVTFKLFSDGSFTKIEGGMSFEHNMNGFSSVNRNRHFRSLFWLGADKEELFKYHPLISRKLVEKMEVEKEEAWKSYHQKEFLLPDLTSFLEL